MRSHTNRNSAVSPVIGILLMLVITVIIAAVISGFAGSFVQGQHKVPQAQIAGKLSLQDGFFIQHNGGDPIPTNDVVITIRSSRLFGPGAEQMSVQVVDHLNITTNNKSWLNPNGTIGVTSFNGGDIAVIKPADCDCDKLQPDIAPTDFTTDYDAATITYSGSDPTLWALCFKNPDNVGKRFIMDVSDRATGKIISTANVPIVG